MWGYRVYYSPDGEAGTGTSAGTDDPKMSGDTSDKKPALTLDEALAKIDQLDKEYKITKAEAADRRRKLEAFEKAAKDKSDAELSEVEKVKKQYADLEVKHRDAEAKLRAHSLREQFRQTVGVLKIKWVNPKAEDDAFQLADVASLEIDEQGKVTGLDTALKALQKDRPYLFASEDSHDINTGQGKGAGPAKASNIDTIKRRYGI